MADIIDGKKIAQGIMTSAKEIVSTLTEKPKLACILVGDDPASASYVKSKVKACDKVGIESMVIKFPSDCTAQRVAEIIKQLAADDSVTGILLQLPLPEQIERYRDTLLNLIPAKKDVDCLTDENLGRLFANKEIVAPCTASGVMEILKNMKYNLEGKDAVVIGRSLLAGKSISALLTNANATVTVCHSRTKNLKEKTKNADLVVVAVGKPNFVDASFIKPGAVVIDVGINRVKDESSPKGYKIVGDVNFEDVKDKCYAITPVPGGVGPLTVACLMLNTATLGLNKTYKISKPLNPSVELKGIDK